MFPCTELKLQPQNDCIVKVSRTHLFAEIAKCLQNAVVNICVELKEGKGLGWCWCALRPIQNKPSSVFENPFLLKQLWSKDIWQQCLFCSANDVVGKEQTI